MCALQAINHYASSPLLGSINIEAQAIQIGEKVGAIGLEPVTSTPDKVSPNTNSVKVLSSINVVKRQDK